MNKHARLHGILEVGTVPLLMLDFSYQKEEGNYMNQRKKKSKNADWESKKLFLLILPFLILCFLFSYFSLHGWVYALYDYRAPLKLSQCEFVGLKWFQTLFNNPTQVSQLITVMKNTFAMSLLGIATSFLPVLFAIFLNEIKSKKFRNVVQTFTTLPNFISWTLVYSVAFCLFSTTGMFNTVMQNLGILSEPVKILDSSSHVWLQMLLWSTWKGLGWGAIMYLAAIAGIDQEMYDAAKVDGAGRFQKMWHVTVPGLIPTYCVMLLMSIANILSNGMDQYLVFENAQNTSYMQVLDLYVYQLGIGSGNIPLSTVIGMVKSIVSVILLFAANGISKAIRGESIV